MEEQVLGRARVDIVADLSKLDAQLQASLSAASVKGQQVGQALGKGINSGAAESFDEFRARVNKLGEDAERSLARIKFADSIASQVAEAKKNLDGLGSDLQSFGQRLTFGVTVPLTGLAVAAIKSSADIQALKLGLVAITGSAEEAERQFADLVEVAKLPGIEIEGALRGSSNLQAFGFSAKEAKTILLELGNAMAAAGKSSAELDRVVYNIGQLGSGAKVSSRDLRELVQAIPQAGKVLREQFGPEILSEPAKRLEELGLTGKDLVNTLTIEFAKMPRVTGGLKNDLENFSQDMKLSLARLGDAIAPLIGPALKAVTTTTEALVGAFTALPEPAQKTVIVLGAVAAATGPAIYGLGTMARSISDLISLAERFGIVKKGAEIIAEMGSTSTSTGTALGALERAAASAAGRSGIGALSTAIGTISGAGALYALYALWEEANKAPATLGEMERSLGKVSDELKKLTKNATDYEIAIKSAFQRQAESVGGIEVGSRALRQSIEYLEGEAERLGLSVSKAGLSLSDYQKALADAVGASKGLSADFKISVDSLSKSSQDLISSQDELRAKYEQAKRTVAELTAEQKAGRDVTVALELANQNLKKAYGDLHPSMQKTHEEAKIVKGSLYDLLEQQKDLGKAYTDALSVFDALAEMQSQGVDVSVALKLADDNLTKALEDLQAQGEYTFPVFDLIAGRMTDSAVEAAAAADAFLKTADAMKTIDGALDESNGKMVELGGVTAEVVKVYDGDLPRGLDKSVTVIRGLGASAKTTADESKGLATSADGAAVSISHIGTAAAGSVASVERLGDAIKGAQQELRDFMYASEVFGPGSGGSFSLGTYQPDLTKANAGDIKKIIPPDSLGTLAGKLSTTYEIWSVEEIDAYRKTLSDLTEAQRALAQNGFSVTATETKKLIQQSYSLNQSISDTVALWVKIREEQGKQNELTKETKAAADQYIPTLSDLEDQLWRLIDAGKGNTSAAADLRTQIGLLGGYMDKAADATTKVAKATSSFIGVAVETSRVIDEIAKKYTMSYIGPSTPITSNPSSTSSSLATTISQAYQVPVLLASQVPHGENGYYYTSVQEPNGTTLYFKLEGKTASEIGSEIVDILRREANYA